MKIFVIIFLIQISQCNSQDRQQIQESEMGSFQLMKYSTIMGYYKRYKPVIDFKLPKLTEYFQFCLDNLRYNSDFLSENEQSHNNEKQSINQLTRSAQDLLRQNEIIQNLLIGYKQSAGDQMSQKRKISMISVYNKNQYDSFQQQKELVKKVRYQFLKNQEELQTKQYEELQKKKLKKYDSCNQRLMSAFGLVGKAVHKSQYTQTNCVYNQKSCCTQQHIDSVLPFLEDNLEKINKKFDLIEMFLVQFKGYDFLYTMQLLFNDENSLNSIQKKLDLMDITVQKFRTQYIFENVQKSENLLDRLSNLKKNVDAKARNVLCAICNPNDNNYFIEDETLGLIVKYHQANCQTFFEKIKFEFDLIDFYQNFVSIIATAILNKTGSKSSKSLFPLNHKKIIEQKQKYEDCYLYFNMNDDNCQELCKNQNLLSFSFHFDFLEAIKLSLDIVFKTINRYEFDEMLESINFRNVQQVLVNDKVYFFDKYNPLFIKGNYQNFQLQLEEQNALIIKSDIMENRYTNLNKINIYVCVLISFFILIFQLMIRYQQNSFSIFFYILQL